MPAEAPIEATATNPPVTSAPTTGDKQSRSGQKVYITDVEVKNQSIFDNDSSQYYDADKKRLTLKSSDDDLSLEFSALNLTSADKIQYAYKLDGLNNDWVYMGNNRRFVNYTNLPAGKYTFMVKATDESGTWSNQITTLEIIKKPPFYLSWWAYLVYLILLGVLGLALDMVFRKFNKSAFHWAASGRG